MDVRTRFAPSPTGVLHLGSIRTALFCWLYARHRDGAFVLRIEDTDRERSTEENVQAIFDGMDWLGLDADEGPFFQTRRFDRYREVVDRWLEEGKAYHCYCTKGELDELRARQLASGEKVGYDGRCRDRNEPREGVDPVVRFRNPVDGEVVVSDQVRGTVVFDNAQLDDLIIARSDGTPTYNFTVVVDDAKPVVQTFAQMFGCSEEEMLRHPHALFGGVDSICEELERRREQHGISYFTVGEDNLDAFAPVVARLTGK